MNYLGCVESCRKQKKPCDKNMCRHWMEYDTDLNCSIIAAEDNGPMTLEEISKRMDLTIVRVKQIQDEALLKMKKRILPILNE